MLIDCNTCVARDLACGDCVITVLLAGPPPATRPARESDVSDTHEHPLDFDDVDRFAIEHLASAGLVPPLRLVQPLPAGNYGDAERSPMSGKGREIA